MCHRWIRLRSCCEANQPQGQILAKWKESHLLLLEGLAVEEVELDVGLADVLLLLDDVLELEDLATDEEVLDVGGGPDYSRTESISDR